MFAAGWTLDSAEAMYVAGDQVVDVLAELSSLVDHNLVVLSYGQADAPRYRMLDVVREYAVQRRDALGETQVTASRHAEHFLTLAERAEPELRGSQQMDWHRRLETELPNLRLAFRWLLLSGDTQAGLRLAGAMWMFWLWQGGFAEGRQWLTEALSMAGDGHPASRSKALWGAGWLAYHQGDLAAAVARAETLLEVAERTGNPLDERNGLTLRGMAAMADGRYRDSIAPFERGLEICRGLEPGWLLATSALNLGAALMHAGDVERGEILFAEARTRYCELGDQAYEARVKGHLAACHIPAASELLRSYLTTDSGGDWGLAESLEGLSLAASAEGDAFRAGLLDAAAAALRERIGTRPHAFDRALLARYAASLDEHVWDVGWQVGLGMPLPDVIHLAVGP